jgi:hypothetical protein
LRRRIELLQSRQNALRLRALGRDGSGMRPWNGGREQPRSKQADQKCRKRSLPPRHAK